MKISNVLLLNLLLAIASIAAMDTAEEQSAQAFKEYERDSALHSLYALANGKPTPTPKSSGLFTKILPRWFGGLPKQTTEHVTAETPYFRCRQLANYFRRQILNARSIQEQYTLASELNKRGVNCTTLESMQNLDSVVNRNRFSINGRMYRL